FLIIEYDKQAVELARMQQDEFEAKSRLSGCALHCGYPPELVAALESCPPTSLGAAIRLRGKRESERSASARADLCRAPGRASGQTRAHTVACADA
ncbi:hypothetical protein TRAPUB_13850, partial [Trametes pubescens]